LVVWVAPQDERNSDDTASSCQWGIATGMAKDTRDKDARSAETTLIRDLAEVLNDTGLTEIELEREGLRVRVARQVTVSAAVGMPNMGHAMSGPMPLAAPSAPSPAEVVNHPGTVKSPMVGTAYLAAEPGAANFVEIGSRVTAGQTLLIIEAMKTMNHIPAPRAGVVKAIMVENAKPVEFGEPLIVIE
jgi:acetyl-CoA carboxylase biotin carboxyl carrier protein